MQRLWFLEPGKLEWREERAPELMEPTDALVRPIAATTCDLDRMILEGTTPFGGPLALGHECVAEVVALGEASASLHVGQLVILPWHVSCGHCDRCHRDRHNTCRSFAPGAMYGTVLGQDFGSFFSDLVRIPHAAQMLVPLPPGLDPIACASASDNLPFGYELTVPHLLENPGADVLVMGGCGSVAVYAAAFARAAGAREVVYVDTNPTRLDLAARYGATVIEGPAPSRMSRTFPITVDASSTDAGLICAIRSTEPEGTCSSVGTHWSDVSFPMQEMYAKGIHFHTGRGRGYPNIRKALDFVSAGRIDAKLVVSEVIPFADAPHGLARPSLKPVLYRPPTHARG